MSYDTLRVYEDGRFRDAPLPDWYREANRLCEQQQLDWDRAVERVLDCEVMMLTSEATMGCLITVHAWPSALHGFLVRFETPVFLVEEVLIPNPTDWLPFMTTHITPLIAAAAQGAAAEGQERLANAFIAWARHGKGSHIDRETGESRIDLDDDRNRCRAQQTRAAMARASREGSA